MDAETDKIVREVLQRLGAVAGKTASSVQKQAVKQAVKQPSQPAPAATELRLAEPVISLKQLTGKLVGVRRVVVGTRSVVTPAVRDLLRDAKIELGRSDAAAEQTGGQIVLAAVDTAYEPSALVRLLAQQGLGVQRLPQCGLLAAVDELVDGVVKSGQIGVLLTRATAAAACVANRSHGVRAVLATSLDAVRAARAAIAANLLVVDPTGRGLFELSAMVRACTAGPTACPDALKQRLG
ncbi:MAG: hypothetical protein K8T25_20875 [Planctomycetia bacterium]|nr:hypothetical protein [Planctomycetia bacterium]